jgi:DNA-binding IclR family transcriptional regulator
MSDEISQEARRKVLLHVEDKKDATGAYYAREGEIAEATGLAPEEVIRCLNDLSRTQYLTLRRLRDSSGNLEIQVRPRPPRKGS